MSHNEKYSFASRTTILLVAALLLMPALASAATHPLFNLGPPAQ